MEVLVWVYVRLSCEALKSGRPGDCNVFRQGAGVVAGVVKAPPKLKADRLVLIKHAATDIELTGEQIRDQVLRIDDLRRARLRVNRVSAIKKGTLIEVRDDESMSKILLSTGFTQAGPVATTRELRRPEMKVYDVLWDMSDTEVLTDVKEQNLERAR